MRIALAQTNPRIADFPAIRASLLGRLAEARLAGAELVVFPELSTLGYPPRDLLLRAGVVEANLRLRDEIAHEARGTAVILGFASRHAGVGRPLFNAAGFCDGGAVRAEAHKRLLPTYDIFDEARYFEPGGPSAPVDFAGCRLGLTVCEDIWNDADSGPQRVYAANPVADLVRGGANLLVNISASPFWQGKERARVELLSGIARKYAVPLVYVNQVGGNDDVIFDGQSLAFGPDGRMMARAASFAEDLLVVDLPSAGPPVLRPAPDGDVAAVYEALVLGLRDYVAKCGFREVVLGLSGGIDSALTACLAVDALGAGQVHGLALPSRFSSDHSREDAAQLAKSLGIRFDEVSIEPVFSAYLATLAPVFAGRPPDLAEENLQARIRGAILMALSNKFGKLLLSTGNKSEVAVGYCTLYGDMCGGLDVLADVPKMLVYELSKHANRDRRRIPQRTFDKPPSAELKPNQTDQDSLPPYDVLDQILRAYIEDDADAEVLVSRGFRRELVNDVMRMVDRAEFKRRQAAPGLKVTTRAFGPGRRMPIAHGYRG